jgi:ABC-type uncharacterized transport system substrate-binding protein
MKAIQLVPAEVRAAADIDAALQELAREGVGIVVVAADPMFLYGRRRIATLAVQAMLPVVYAFREHVDDGGLMSCGIDLQQNNRRAATYVDKILKGANSAKDIFEQTCAINAHVASIKREIGFISLVVLVAAVVWLIPAVKSWLGF